LIQLAIQADEQDVSLQWREAGGPTTKPPERHGYAAKLFNAMTQQLGGTVDYDWHPEGLIARGRLPIASLGN
jgi:two-component sensor histidine kinase